MSDAQTALAVPAAERATPAHSLSPLMAWLIAAVAVATFLMAEAPHAPFVLNLILPDSDDVLRLLGVRDLLAGQSWFDTHQYRYLPPDGALMHWSRLADAPLAAAIWRLTPMLGARTAEGVVALAWPLLLFLAYLSILAATVSRIAPRIATATAIVVASQMVVFHFIFRVGRIDHHGLQVVLIVAAAFCFAFYGRFRRAPEITGLFSALSLAIGLETLPFVAVVGVANVLAWALGEDPNGRHLVRYALTLAAVALAAFAVQTAPALWTVPACDMLSAPWLLLACGGAGVSVALALATPRLTTPASRLAAAAAGGVLLVAGFALAYPQCLAGPYGMVPEPYRSIWLGDIVEAQPGWLRLALGSDNIFQAIGVLAAAAIAAPILARLSEGATQRLMAVSAACLGVGLLLGLMQVRGLYVVSAFVPPVAAIAVWRIIEALRERRLTGARTVAAMLAALTFLGPVWSAPALAVRQLAMLPDHAERPVSDCLQKQNLSRLNRLPRGLVLAPIDLGAYTLLYTHHSIIAAGFHRAAEGIVAGIDAFKGSEADMRHVVTKFAPDYVVVCADWAEADTTRPMPFTRALAEGSMAKWLEPVPLDAGALKVWRVRPQGLLRRF